ncbi:MBL fold metallo-hydrolase [Paenibacillus alvei]|uniref:MBL fold metallo-hydrolase n=1 Tax=Paenibacillus alvei TaxID=44250 RepID=UPI0002884BAB|nr:MBL fold metallo-hydrolase [Paenibacillus alvei]EJW16953.1 beta-lactamase domain protein [Paenibacillus alvei DSM 29]MCY7485383.1 MBL fold metallo-hydrolase [Paenibacillus alvei]MCY9539068.1 MBL fold metallo-hydrolase [Paenibacillus alvei]MCY9708007.1 MBL fold metallo-hydrolase [Paenibacillus alvei]MCY9734398.1 MBL fold metallo-hydrolase [Paenibacillus alvei]
MKFQQVNEHIFLVRMPLPFSLRWVNTYLLQGSTGWTIVDPGLRTEETEAAWLDLMEELNIEAGNTASIVLTHYHPDHSGMAGWLQQRLAAPVWLSEIGWRHVERMWAGTAAMTMDMQDLFHKQGAPAEVVESIGIHMNSFIPQVSPLPEVSFIRDGEPLLLGDNYWQPIETGGHAPGHMSFYHADSRIMLCGDHVLPQITPNVSLMPNSDPEPLYSFLIGLERLAAFDVELALPGHRHPFPYYKNRTDELIRHHEARLQEMQAALHEPMTAYELCCISFGTLDRLTVHQFRFAMGETLAHLVELRRRGLANTDSEQVIRWQSS